MVRAAGRLTGKEWSMPGVPTQTVILLSGIPATRKSTFGNYLARAHSFAHYDLRHTAASWRRMKGADIHTVALLLGHKDLRMAARYQHTSPTFLADAVSQLDKSS